MKKLNDAEIEKISVYLLLFTWFCYLNKLFDVVKFLLDEDIYLLGAVESLSKKNESDEAMIDIDDEEVEF